MLKETVRGIQEYFGNTQIGREALKEINASTDAKRRQKITELSAIETEVQAAFSRTDGDLKKAEAAFRDAEAKLKTAGERLIFIRKQRQSLGNAAESKCDKLRRELDELALDVIAKRYRQWESEIAELRQRKPRIKYGSEVSVIDQKPVNCYSDLPYIKRRIEALAEARQALAEFPWRYATEAETVKALDELYASLPAIGDEFVAVDMVGEPLKRLA